MIVLENYASPETGVFEIQLNQVVEVLVSAEKAQKIANRWVMDHVNYMMGADSPTFVIGAEIVWRVPVILTATHVGRVGEVGLVDVDVMTGAILGDKMQTKREMQLRAQKLNESLPPYQPRQTVPEKFIPPHLPVAQLIQVR